MSGRYFALIRHGAYHQRENVPSALQPHPLTDEGIAQARDCAGLVRALQDAHDLTLNPVSYSSRQLRAWQTAKETTGALSPDGRPFPIVETEALSERSVGSAANLTLDEIEAALTLDPRFDTPPAGWKSDSDFCLPYPGAESLMMAGARVAGFLAQLAQQPGTKGKMTLIFGHGAAFRHAAHCLGVMARDEIAAHSMYHARPLLICYTQGGTWAHSGGAWKVRKRDETLLD